MKYRIFKPTLILTVILTLLTVIACSSSKNVPNLTSEPTDEAAGNPINIIIYSDFQCGACQRLNSEVEPELRRMYESTGKANIEIRLIGAISDDSVRAAEAALCAGDQGKFLEYKDALFKAWLEMDVDALTTDQLVALAELLDLDVLKFKNSFWRASKH